MAQSKYTRKIKALLAKAKHPNTPAEEAAVAASMAAELMMRHGIDESQLRDSEGRGPEEITLMDMELPDLWAKALQTGIGALAKSIGAQAIIVEAGTITMVGTQSMLDNLETLITCLEQQLVTASNREGDQQEAKIRKAHPNWSDNQVGNAVDRWVDDYIVGWGLGVAQKIENRRNAIADEAPGNALVLRTEADRVRDAFNEMFPHRTSARRRQRDMGAVSAGHRDGQNADIGGGRVSGKAQHALT